MSDQAVAPRQRSGPVTNAASVKELLKSDSGYEAAFRKMLGDRAPQFISSIVHASARLPIGTDPHTIIGAAAIAATLDLPIDPNLGFAYIVPYAGKGQFQMGYKGLVQLGLRSGQYARMNAKPINLEAFGGYDDVGDPIIHWDKLDETKEAVGYAFAWKLVNGFTKTVYWTHEKVMHHAEKFSQAYRAKKKDSPWFTNELAMCLKTVIKDGLTHWGILSVQMQTALRFDQSTVKEIGSEPEYTDSMLSSPGPKFDEDATKAAKKAKMVGDSEPAQEPATAPVTEPSEKENTAATNPISVQDNFAQFCDDAGIPFDDARDYLSGKGLLEDAGSYASFDELPTETLTKLMADTRLVGALVKTFGKQPTKK